MRLLFCPRGHSEEARQFVATTGPLLRILSVRTLQLGVRHKARKEILVDTVCDTMRPNKLSQRPLTIWCYHPAIPPLALPSHGKILWK